MTNYMCQLTPVSGLHVSAHLKRGHGFWRAGWRAGLLEPGDIEWFLLTSARFVLGRLAVQRIRKKPKIQYYDVDDPMGL